MLLLVVVVMMIMMMTMNMVMFEDDYDGVDDLLESSRLKLIANSA